jgi:FkbM family methyltransferase
VRITEKIAAYLRAARIRGGLNLRGLPLIPKRCWADAPYNRTAFNEFVSWINRLGLDNVRWVVDVGANHGDFAQAASAVHPDSQVLLVEPLPTLHPEITRRAGNRAGRWQLASVALGRSAGNSTLYVDPLVDSVGSLLGFNDEYLREHPETKPGKQFTCEVMTLDNLCHERKVQTIDLLKLDVEGFEFEALAGAAEMLPRTRSVIVEVSRTRHAGGENDPLLKMISLLEAAGLALVAMLPAVYSKDHPWQPIEFNLLARRPESR